MGTKKLINPEPKPVPIKFKVSNIDLVNHKFSIPSDFVVQNDRLKFSISCQYKYNNTTSSLIVSVSYKLLFDEKSIFDFKVDNYYEVKNFDDAVNTNKDSAQKFIQYITNISINQARGIQAPLIKGTKIENLYMPIIQEKTFRDKIQIESITNES